MDKEKEIIYKDIDKKVVDFIKAVEFYADYSNHPLCKADWENNEVCQTCKFKPLCDYRGSENVNLVLHLIDDGYGNIKQAVKEFAEKLKEKIKSIHIARDCEYDEGYTHAVWKCEKIIDDLTAELYGADE